MMDDIVKESGAVFYSPPDRLDEWMDPLIRPICEKINRSGWVWTAESCQGHPDATTSGTWGENTNPMIRLVTQQEARMLSILCSAFRVAKAEAERDDLFEIHGFRAYPRRPKPEWSEILVYIDARTAFQRDQALSVWKSFSDLLTTRYWARGGQDVLVPGGEAQKGDKTIECGCVTFISGLDGQSHLLTQCPMHLAYMEDQKGMAILDLRDLLKKKEGDLVREEREACAQLAGEYAKADQVDEDGDSGRVPFQIEAAIRARGNP